MAHESVNILLVDDNPVDCMRIETLLEQIDDLDVHVVSECDHQAVDIDQIKDYDLMLLDYYLGDTTGIEFAKANHLTESLPVIVLTGTPSNEIDQQSLETGISDLLPKHDIDPSMLSRRIRYTLHHFNRTQVLKNQAFYDALTQLHSRQYFEEQAITAICKLARSGEGLGVLMIDLDKFKAINDTYGHAAGDYALQFAAKQISKCVRDTDLVARLGGDEFAVCLENVSSEVLQRVANKIVSEVTSLIDYQGSKLDLGCSVGGTITFLPTLLPDLLARADEALYQVKDAGRGHAIILGMTQ